MRITDYTDYKTDFIENYIEKYSLNSPINILVIGATGVGKSTTLNTLMKRKVATVGVGCDPETMNLNSYELNQFVKFWDSPGLGDSPKKDIIHIKRIKDLLQKENYRRVAIIDLCLILLEPKRDIETTVKLIDELKNVNFPCDRIILAINQADFALKGRHWRKGVNCPDSELKERLKELSKSIQKRVFENTGIKVLRPVYFSAYYNWNVTRLYNTIINRLPKNNRKFL